MAMGPWLFTNSTITNMLNGTFDFDTDTFKVALFLSGSNLGAASTTYAALVANGFEHANANGYTTGGEATTVSLSGTTTVTIDATDVQWTASGGNITARWAVLYEVGGNIVCYALLDSTPQDDTTTNGNILEIKINASGIISATKV